MNIAIAFLLALISLSFTSLEQRQVILPLENLKSISSLPNLYVIASSPELVVVQLPYDQIGELASLLHKSLGNRGGFRDVTHEVLETKQSIEEILYRKLNEKKARFPAIPITRNQPTVDLVASIDASSIEAVLVELASLDDRASTSENGAKAAQLIFEKAAKLGEGSAGFNVRTVATRSYPKQPSVVATLTGKRPDLAHILVGAHMDTLPSNKPGADDDASGCAVVMESLRAVLRSGMQFERSIDFVWYAAEEMGLVGSSSVVKDFQRRQVGVAAAMQFDMVAWVNVQGTHDLYLTDDFTDSGLTQTVERIINTYLPKKTVGHARCGYSCSDHASWTFASVPAVYPFESHHDDDNPTIHTSDDKVDILNMDHAATFAQIAVAYLSHLANSH